MSKTKICVEFKEWGRAFVNIVETDDDQWEPEISSCRDYEFAPGDYTVLFNGQTGDGFKIIVTEDGKQIGHDEYDGGEFSGSVFINVS